jgi:glutamate-1-semialdehyde 2,1-aminomutase
MLKNGFYISPSQFEADFLSISHSNSELDRFIETVKKFS